LDHARVIAMIDKISGGLVGVCRVFRVDSIGTECARASNGGLATRIAGDQPAHFGKVLVCRNDRKLMGGCSEELVELDRLEVIVSDVGVGLCQESKQDLSWLSSPHLPKEARLDLLGQVDELWRIER
jgi:hypothetical protein